MVNSIDRMRVLVMCGGYATRMNGEPKHLLSVTDSLTVMDLSLFPLIQFGVRRFTFLTGYKRQYYLGYMERLRKRGFNIEEYFQEPTGILDAILGYLSRYASATDDVLIWNGDDLLPRFRLSDLIWAHEKAEATRVVARRSNNSMGVKIGGYYKTGVLLISPYRLTQHPDESANIYLTPVLLSINTPKDLEEIKRWCHLLSLLGSSISRTHLDVV